jgi:two-component system chemotaxis response regulator CheY
MRILIVDDSRAMRMIVRRALREAGFGKAETFEGADGNEGLALAKQHNPTVILSDWNMPNCNGLQFLMQLRETSYAGRFGYVTSAATDDMRTAAKQYDADFIIAKPFTPDRFHDALSAKGPGDTNASSAGGSAVIAAARSVHSAPLSAALCQRLCSSLIRRTFEARDTKSPSKDRAPIVAIFCTPDEPNIAALIVERELAMFLGAALSLFPKRVAEEAATSATVPERIQENLHEVLNLFCQAFAGTHGAQVQLRTIETDGRRAAALRRRFLRLDDVAHVEVSIEGYGKGIISMCRSRVADAETA